MYHYLKATVTVVVNRHAHDLKVTVGFNEPVDATLAAQKLLPVLDVAMKEKYSVREVELSYELLPHKGEEPEGEPERIINGVALWF